MKPKQTQTIAPVLPRKLSHDEQVLWHEAQYCALVDLGNIHPKVTEARKKSAVELTKLRFQEGFLPHIDILHRKRVDSSHD